MKYIKCAQLDGSTKLIAAETDPEKVMDLLLDEYNYAKEHGFDLQMITAFMDIHQKTPLAYIPKR